MTVLKECWPYTPCRLSEILDIETLAVIESGCCERIKRPLTILDNNPLRGWFTDRIESIEEDQRYEEFCRALRSYAAVDEACKQGDIEQARISMSHYRASGEPFRCFPCWMGLMDMTYVIQIRKHPVALVFTGQFCPPEGTADIQFQIEQAARSESQLDQNELLECARQLPILPGSARQSLEREALHIQRIAENEYERLKRQWEQEFLDELRKFAIGPGRLNRDALLNRLKQMLDAVRRYCRSEYVIFFGSANEKNTVLMPLAQSGVPETMQDKLPHFNWRKAGLPLELFDTTAINFIEWLPDACSKGLRGDYAAYFSQAACAIPTLLGDRYRGMILFGPFKEQVNLFEERRFLTDLATTIGSFTLTALEVFDLEQERRAWESAKKLLQHQMRTALTPITTLIGSGLEALEMRGGIDLKRVGDHLRQAEDLSLNLSRSVKETLNGRVLKIEADELKFERFPLPVLVGNCAAGFFDPARSRGLELVLDSSVEFLPEADIDVARMTIALANLIENAIKYAYADSKIYLRSQLEPSSGPEGGRAIIEVDDLGVGINVEEQQRIFEEGERGQLAGKIPGTGYGLWETSSIVKAHGGVIRLKVTPTPIHRREGRAHRVIFAIVVPFWQRSTRRYGD